MTALEAETIALAGWYIGKRELSSNSSPEIDPCLAHVHQPPGMAYCAAWVSYVIYHGGLRVPVLPKFKRSASALRLLDLNLDLRLTLEEAIELMREERPVGFVLNMGKGKGHTGFGFGLVGSDCFRTREGNTGPGPNVPAKDREGDGFYERTDRKLASVHGWFRIA